MLRIKIPGRMEGGQIACTLDDAGQKKHGMTWVGKDTRVNVGGCSEIGWKRKEEKALPCIFPLFGGELGNSDATTKRDCWAEWCCFDGVTFD